MATETLILCELDYCEHRASKQYEIYGGLTLYLCWCCAVRQGVERSMEVPKDADCLED